MEDHKEGFTLIELLTVITIIGLLSTVVTVSLRSANRKAKYAKAKAEMSNLVKMIDVARLQSGKTFIQITGSGCSECACRNRGDLSLLPKSDSCWTNYLAAFDKIKVAAEPGGIALVSAPTDPWGAPFLFNENEGEACCCPDTVTWCCTDNIHSAGPDRILSLSTSDDDINVNIPTRNCAPTAGSHHPNQNW